jgi:hypothetical protein
MAKHLAWILTLALPASALTLKEPCADQGGIPLPQTGPHALMACVVQINNGGNFWFNATSGFGCGTVPIPASVLDTVTVSQLPVPIAAICMNRGLEWGDGLDVQLGIDPGLLNPPPTP